MTYPCLKVSNNLVTYRMTSNFRLVFDNVKIVNVGIKNR